MSARSAVGAHRPGVTVEEIEDEEDRARKREATTVIDNAAPKDTSLPQSQERPSPADRERNSPAGAKDNLNPESNTSGADTLVEQAPVEDNEESSPAVDHEEEVEDEHEDEAQEPKPASLPAPIGRKAVKDIRGDHRQTDDSFMREAEAIRKEEEAVQKMQQEMQKRAEAIKKRKEEAAKQRETAEILKEIKQREQEEAKQNAAIEAHINPSLLSSPVNSINSLPVVTAEHAAAGPAHRAMSPLSYRAQSTVAANGGLATARGAQAFAAWQSWGSGTGLARSNSPGRGILQANNLGRPSVSVNSANLGTAAGTKPAGADMRRVLTAEASKADDEYKRALAEIAAIEAKLAEHRAKIEKNVREAEAKRVKVASLRKEAGVIQSLFELRSSSKQMAAAETGRTASDRSRMGRGEGDEGYEWLRVSGATRA